MSEPPNKNPKTFRAGKPGQTQRVIKLSVSEDQVAFRLLCSITAAGGVIGHSGAVVRRLERETSARIHVEEAFSPTTTERVIHVVGSHYADRNLRFSDDGQVFDVSAAQEALIRVFERILEVSDAGDGVVVRCRLLLAEGMAGAVIGEGGKRVNKIQEDTGAHIKVFPAGSLPPFAAMSDELIQITGGSLAVKKALVIVSQYLQKKASQFPGASSRVLLPSMSMNTNDAGSNDKVGRGVAREVVFRLLCTCDGAGAVIGWKGRKVKALEEETGASVRCSAIEAGCNERVITVTAFENKESHYSAAQNAFLRVFSESTSSGRRETVTARVLIPPNQAGWLNAGASSIFSSIQKATDAKLQILERNRVPGAITNERIIQIDGDYSSVLIALFQVSWSLRESYFNTLVAPLLPHKLFNSCPSLDETAMVTGKMNNCRVSEVNCSVAHQSPYSQFSNGLYSTNIEPPTNLSAVHGGLEAGSENKCFMVTNTKVEIVVREDVFSSVYGDDGSNLARLRQISGATVDVQDPALGSEGKVMISGTPDQVRAAQSLLQAFMMSAV